MQLLLEIFLLGSLFLRVQSFKCPDGSEQMPNEDVCMFLNTQTDFYYDVIRRCSSLGGIPAKVQNLFENSYLFAMLAADVYGAPFIGVERKQNNTWTFADGSPLTYQNWAPDEPNMSSNSSACAIMSTTNGKWYSAECTFARTSLCSINGDDEQCPVGWVYNDQLDYCYYLQDFVYTDGTHWLTYPPTSAEQLCNRMGAHLVSIHSKQEDDFLSGLVQTDVRNLTVSDPCNNQWARIGLVGTGVIGVGTWTDGTPVDYTAHAPTGSSWWMIANDRGCTKVGWEISNGNTARFVCKMPSKRKLTIHKK